MLFFQHTSMAENIILGICAFVLFYGFNKDSESYKVILFLKIRCQFLKKQTVQEKFLKINFLNNLQVSI